MCLLLQISSRNSLFEMLLWILFFFQFTYNFTLLFILFLFTSVILGVVKIGGPWTQSMKGVHGPGPYFDGPRRWTGSTDGVYEPGVHVLYFPWNNLVVQIYCWASLVYALGKSVSTMESLAQRWVNVHLQFRKWYVVSSKANNSNYPMWKKNFYN